jgi:5-methylcytosine-specific restriction endonuclease McrA
MDRSRGNDEGVIGRAEAVSTHRSKHMAVLGKASPPPGTPVHPQTAPFAERPTGVINTATVLQLLEWQNYRCALTGRPLTPETASLDHIVPVRDGGPHVIENVQVLHKDINRAKSTLAHEQFIQLCREVVDHAASANTEGV